MSLQKVPSFGVVSVVSMSPYTCSFTWS